MKKISLISGIIGVLLIILSRAGFFTLKKDLEGYAIGATISIEVENKSITYPLLGIGIILILFAIIQYNKSKKVIN